MEGWKNPARYLAPLAIAAVAWATYTIVHRAIADEHTTSTTSIVQTTPAVTQAVHRDATKAKFYVVQSNDTLSRIAAKTGVALGTIEALNPSINPDSLHPGQRLRLRQ